MYAGDGGKGQEKGIAIVKDVGVEGKLGETRFDCPLWGSILFGRQWRVADPLHHLPRPSWSGDDLGTFSRGCSARKIALLRR